MKRKLLLLNGLLLVGGAAQAQLIVRAGINSAFMSTIGGGRYFYATAQTRPGYQLGVAYEKAFSPRWSVLPEVQLLHQNTKLHVEDRGYVADGGYRSDTRQRLSFVSVPVLLRATFGKLYVEAGPQANFLLRAHEKGTEAVGSIAGESRRDIDQTVTGQYRRFDAGLCVGIGAKLPTGLGLGVRISQGLLPLTDDQQTRYGAASTVGNKLLLQGSVSYQLKPRS